MNSSSPINSLSTPLLSGGAASIEDREVKKPVALKALVPSSLASAEGSSLAKRGTVIRCAADAALEAGIPGAGVFFSPTDERFIRGLTDEKIKKGDEALKDIVPRAEETRHIQPATAGKVVGLSPMLTREIFSYIPAKGCQVARHYKEHEGLDSARRQQFFEYVLEPKSSRFIDIFKSDYSIFEDKILRNRGLKDGGIDVNYHMLFETFINKNPEENTWLMNGLLFKCARKNYTDIVRILLNRPEFAHALTIGHVISRFEEHNHLESIQMLIDENIINADNVDDILGECFKHHNVAAINILLRAFPDPEQDRVHRMIMMSIDRNSFDVFSKILDAQREFELTPDLIGHIACMNEFLLYCLTHTKISDEQIKNLLLISLDTPRIYRDDAIKNFRTLLKAVDLTVEERDFLLNNTPGDYGSAIDAIIASGPTTEAVRQIALTRKVAAERSCCCFRWF